MPPRLPRNVVAELEHAAHRGKAEVVGGLVAKAAAAYDREDYASALAPLLRAKTDAPRSATVRQLLGLVHYRLGRFRDAAREFAAYRRLTEHRDLDPLLADCERALGRPEKALEILDGLTATMVGDETAAEGLVIAAGALVDLGRHTDAIELLERAPLRPRIVHPYHLRLWYALADALERAGRRPDARPWWDLIYTEDPGFFDVAQRRLR